MLGKVVLAVDQATPDFAREALWEGMNGWARWTAIFLDVHGVALCAGCLALLAGVAACLPRWRGPWRVPADSWPIFSLYRDFQAGMLFSTLAMLLRSGQTLQAGLEDAAECASPWMRWHLGRILSALDENPNAVLDAFRRGILSRPLLARAMTLNRSSQTFADVLVQLGTRESERVVERVKITARVANAAVVGAVAGVAVFMGVASITVPGRFASLMEPSTLMMLKARHDSARAPS
jgi:type II secretory pathway component PulF